MTAIDVESFSNELNKLKKSDLIDIIINKKYTDNASNDILSKYLILHFNKDNALTDKLDKLQTENKNLAKQLKLSEKVIEEQEKRNKNLETINELLTEKNRNSNSSAISETKIKQKEKNKLNDGSETKKTVAITEENNSIELVDNKNNDNQGDNKNRYKKQNVIRGTSISGNITFSAATKYAWLYVGRAKKDTTEDQIKNYLNDKLPGNDFIVEYITKNPEARSAAFKVGLDYNQLEIVQSSDFWPSNILVKRFTFFRRSGTFDK